MISRLIRESFHAPLLTALLVAAGTTIGAFWMQDLRRDVFPDLSAPVFNVITQNAAMGAEELETAIAIPLEVALAGSARRAPRAIELAARRRAGHDRIRAERRLLPLAAVRRRARRAGVRAASAGTDPPLISSLTGRLNEIFEFTLEADPGAADLMTLRDLAEFEVNNRLLAVPGVAAVERLGGYLRQFQVQLDPERMSARMVSLDDVMHAVEESNLNASGGIVAQGVDRVDRARARPRADASTTCAAPWSRREGMCRCCSATSPTFARRRRCRRGVAHRLKGEVVSARIIKQFGSDTVTVAAGIRGAVEDIRRTLPKGVQLRIVYDQSQLVSSALGGVGRAVMLGGVFVVLVILLLLGNVRAALVVTLTIPLSIALAGLLLRPLGVGLEHDDAGRPGDRRRPAGRRRDHHGREHPAPAERRHDSARASGASAARRGRSRSPDRVRDADRHRRVPAAVRHDRHRRPHVSAAGGRRHRGDGRGARPGAHAGADRGRAGAEAARAREPTRTSRSSARSSSGTRRRWIGASGIPSSWPSSRC